MEEAKTTKRLLKAQAEVHESRIPIVVQDSTSIANIVQEKLTATGSRVEDGSVRVQMRRTPAVHLPRQRTQLSRLTWKTMQNKRFDATCWRTLMLAGVRHEFGPIAKQTKTENAYRWQCWQDDNRWSTPTQMFAGTNYVCRGRTLLTGSATDLTNYGCTAPTVNGTKNCNYDPQAEVDDGSCVDAEDLIKPGYDCYGAAIESQRVCQIGSCTDDELVKAYQKVNQGCGVTEGAHTYRPDRAWRRTRPSWTRPTTTYTLDSVQ